MTHEEITLSTGETLIVERRKSDGSSHYITLWATVNGKPNQEAASISKVYHYYGAVAKWRLATIEIRGGQMRLEQIARHIEIVNTAAALAAELDKAYPAGEAIYD